MVKHPKKEEVNIGEIVNGIEADRIIKEGDKVFKIIGSILVIIFILSLSYTIYYLSHPEKNFIMFSSNKCSILVKENLNQNSSLLVNLKGIKCSENIAYCYCQYTYKNYNFTDTYKK